MIYFEALWLKTCSTSFSNIVQWWYPGTRLEKLRKKELLIVISECKKCLLSNVLIMGLSHNRRQQEVYVNNALITIPEAAPARREFKYLWGVPSCEKHSARCSLRERIFSLIVRSSVAVQHGLSTEDRPRQRRVQKVVTSDDDLRVFSSLDGGVKRKPSLSADNRVNRTLSVCS